MGCFEQWWNENHDEWSHDVEATARAAWEAALIAKTGGGAEVPCSVGLCDLTLKRRLKMFAKLYETEETGQVLLKLAEGEEGPEVRYYFVPKGLGVCSTALEFKDSEKGTAWDKAEAYFNKIDEESAIQMAKAMMLEIGKIT